MPPEGQPATAVGPVVIVGAGRVGASIALDLGAAGPAGDEPPLVTVVGRQPEPPYGLGNLASVRYAHRPPNTSVAGVVFCVPDDRLAEVVDGWSRAGHADLARVALHTSGSHPSGILAPLREAGARVAAWHPIVALSHARAGGFRGVTFGVEGDESALLWGDALATRLGGRTLRVDPDRKATYHLASVHSANLLVAALSTATRLLAESLPPDTRAASEADPGLLLPHLLPLARSALDAVEAEGLVQGATGPVARGDVGTVERHLAALDRDRQTVYRLLSAELVRLLSDRLTPETRARFREVLGTGQEGG